jgi:hypothetical protein
MQRLRFSNFNVRTTAAGHSADTHDLPVRQTAVSAPDRNQLGNFSSYYRHGVLWCVKAAPRSQLGANMLKTGLARFSSRHGNSQTAPRAVWPRQGLGRIGWKAQGVCMSLIGLRQQLLREAVR